MTMSYVYQSPATLLERQPTLRVDYNLSPKHRLSGSASSLWAKRDPDYLNNTEARFPGAPNYRVFASTRPLYSFTLRSTLSANMVNELKGGLTAYGGAGSRFGQPTDPSQSAGSFADIGGYAVIIPFTTDWWTTAAPSWRAAPTFNIDNSLSWQRGNHSLNIGGSYLKSSAWENAQQVVPADRRSGSCRRAIRRTFMFNTTNFPGATNGNLNDARAHYAQLTGRISEITGQVALDPATNQYVPHGPRRREGHIQVISAFTQDYLAHDADADAQRRRCGTTCRRRSCPSTTRCRR